MKKRIIILLVAIASLILMSACSNETAEASPNLKTTLATEVVENVPETTENPNIISMDAPLVIIDNDYLKVEIIRFRKENKGSHMTGPNTWEQRDGDVYYVDMKFYNKSEYTYQIGGDFYIADESVYKTILGNRLNFAPEPGKNAMMEAAIYRWDGIQELPIELEELYQLNGTITIFGNDISFTKFNFSIPDALTSIE